jgi:very-short-patch-repair endonuclease
MSKEKEYKLSNLEIKFKAWLDLCKFDGYEMQYSPKIKGRKWRIDFAYVDLKIGIEIQGINYTTGYGHQDPSTMKKDYEKNNALVSEGWRMFYFTGNGDSADSHGYLSEVLRSCLSGE